MSHDQTYAYEYMHSLMKIVAWYRNDPPDKPWVMKTPQHMQDLDALIKVFPNARIVCPHRDPVKVIGSLCSMSWNAIVRDSDSLSAEWVGPYWLDKAERMLHKTDRVRAQMIPAANQHDLLYADMSANWQQAMTGVYDFLDLPLTEAAKAGMQGWLDSNSQHKHGAHKYQLEDFGLNKAQVDQRLGFYRQQFNIPYETKNPHITSKGTL